MYFSGVHSPSPWSMQRDGMDSFRGSARTASPVREPVNTWTAAGGAQDWALNQVSNWLSVRAVGAVIALEESLRSELHQKLTALVRGEPSEGHFTDGPHEQTDFGLPNLPPSPLAMGTTNQVNVDRLRTRLQASAAEPAYDPWPNRDWQR